ncbi:MAG: hypothetical protein JWM04_2062 [Verrucomicrobiales bacterium]|nr:hypothetical protein [Verrucomicrobiales bacterium]
MNISIKINSGRGGLTLLEILVSTAVLLIIVLGLTAMFHETQRAFVTGVSQIDTMGGARSAVELMAFDMEQIKLRNPQDPLTVGFAVTNGQKVLSDQLSTLNLLGARTPYLQDVFFTRKTSNHWEAAAYWVSNSVNGVGALYRYSTNVAENKSEFLFRNYSQGTRATSSKIIDGIVYFKVTPYDGDGRPYTKDVLRAGFAVSESAGVFYAGNSATNLPFYVQLELGVLEPPVLAKLNQMGSNIAAQKTFLQSQISKVHVFRQLIPIRTASR